jgi:hypothetical protein
MLATPEVFGAYLAAAGEGYAMPTLRRWLAASARACGVAGHPRDTKHPAIRETLRGIGRKHTAPRPAGGSVDYDAKDDRRRAMRCRGTLGPTPIRTYVSYVLEK